LKSFSTFLPFFAGEDYLVFPPLSFPTLLLFPFKAAATKEACNLTPFSPNYKTVCKIQRDFPLLFLPQYWAKCFVSGTFLTAYKTALIVTAYHSS